LYLKKTIFFWKLKKKEMLLLGQAICLPKRKGGLVEELILYGIHEPVASEIYLSFLKQGMKILEIGTNLGYYLVSIQKSRFLKSKNAGPGGSGTSFRKNCAVQKYNVVKSVCLPLF
jgi:hypothetical protein